MARQDFQITLSMQLHYQHCPMIFRIAHRKITLKVIQSQIYSSCKEISFGLSPAATVDESGMIITSQVLQDT